jgi:hypothetical protein
MVYRQVRRVQLIEVLMEIISIIRIIENKEEEKIIVLLWKMKYLLEKILMSYKFKTDI